MGKRIIAQRRGRGTATYKAHSYRWLSAIKYRKYDDAEKNNCVAGRVIDIVHSRGHSAPIIIVRYNTGENGYMFAPEGIRVSDTVECGILAKPMQGNVLPLKNIPEGASIFNLELNPGDGGKLCRVSGVSARVISHAMGETMVELPSKKHKKINSLCRATIGVIAGKGRKDKPFVMAGNANHNIRKRGK